jgi:hypothetical protein
MIVHRSLSCGDLSLNWIAADDDPEGILAAFKRRVACSSRLQQQRLDQGIRLLQEVDHPKVEACLYGISIPSFI